MLHYIGHVLDSGCILYTIWRVTGGVCEYMYNWALNRQANREE